MTHYPQSSGEAYLLSVMVECRPLEVTVTQGKVSYAHRNLFAHRVTVLSSRQRRSLYVGAQWRETFLNPAVLLPPGFSNPFTVGDPFSWSMTLESAAPDFAPNPTCGVYRPVTATQFTSPGVSFGGNNPQSDYSLHSSTYTVGTLDCITVPPGANIGRLQVFPIGSDLSLFMEFAGIYPTDALVVDPANFHPIAFGVFLFGPDNTLALGHITSVTAVPEPMTALLVACGVVAALRRRQ